jgi:hypothetical protein
MNDMQFPLTKRLTTVWLAAIIVLVTGMVGATAINRRADVQRLEAIRADIRLIDAAATQLAQR